MLKTKIIFVLIQLIAVLPLALLTTILTHPFWRWFEETTGFESYGHSGPSAWCYWMVYSIMVALSTPFIVKLETKRLENPSPTDRSEKY